MPNVLAIVENSSLAAMLEQVLQPLRCGLICISDGAAASRHYDRSHPAIVLVDLSHPHGAELVRRFYQRRQAPVMVLAPDTESAIAALEEGADDAVAAPYDPRLLAARVRARVRRQALVTGDLPDDGLDFVRCGPVLIDLPRYYATLYNTPLDLSPLEFDLLVLFARSPEQMLSKQLIFERVWRTRYIEGDRSVDSAILRLRRKLGNFGDMLETIRGKGYRLQWSGGSDAPGATRTA
jgi:two-component system phosphate regulon response regulator PhoB